MGSYGTSGHEKVCRYMHVKHATRQSPARRFRQSGCCPRIACDAARIDSERSMRTRSVSCIKELSVLVHMAPLTYLKEPHSICFPGRNNGLCAARPTVPPWLCRVPTDRKIHSSHTGNRREQDVGCTNRETTQHNIWKQIC